MAYHGAVTATLLTVSLNAPRQSVYHALSDPHAIATWMVPDGMTSHIHALEERVGGNAESLRKRRYVN